MYRHFGASLQILYVQSILAEIMDVLKVFASFIKVEIIDANSVGIIIWEFTLHL